MLFGFFFNVLDGNGLQFYFKFYEVERCVFIYIFLEFYLDFIKFCFVYCDVKVVVDIDYYCIMFELYQCVNYKEIIVGW